MHPASPTAAQPTLTSTRKVAVATLIGTSIEWYDFFVYGSAAALVFNKLFFPTANPLTGTLLALATFGVGFVARPIGGVVFAHFGDKIGRKSMLVLSVLLMGGGTVAVGLLPTYETIGVAAPIILVVLRFVQGIGLGGEWGAAAVMAVEYAPPHRRGFFGSFPQVGVPAGLLTANLALLLMSGVLSEEAFLAWGWRVPFLASIVLVVVGLVIRLRVQESPVFTQTKAEGRIKRQPVLEVLRTQPGNVLRAAGLRFAENSTFYIHTTFVLTYGTVTLGLRRSDLLLAVIVAAVIGRHQLSPRRTSDGTGRHMPSSPALPLPRSGRRGHVAESVWASAASKTASPSRPSPRRAVSPTSCGTAGRRATDCTARCAWGHPDHPVPQLSTGVWWVRVHWGHRAHNRLVGNYGIDPSWGKEQHRLALIERATTR
jgi:MFS family permease